MSELTYKALEAVREHYTHDDPDGLVVAAVNMALRTLDAEHAQFVAESNRDYWKERAEKAEAEAREAWTQATRTVDELDKARQEAAKLREAVLVGLGAAKFCNMSQEVIDKMTEALHPSDAPASEPGPWSRDQMARDRMHLITLAAGQHRELEGESGRPADEAWRAIPEHLQDAIEDEAASQREDAEEATDPAPADRPERRHYCGGCGREVPSGRLQCPECFGPADRPENLPRWNVLLQLAEHILVHGDEQGRANLARDIRRFLTDESPAAEARPDPSEASAVKAAARRLAEAAARADRMPSRRADSALTRIHDFIDRSAQQPAPVVPQTDAQRGAPTQDEALSLLGQLMYGDPSGQAHIRNIPRIRQYILSQSGQAVPQAEQLQHTANPAPANRPEPNDALEAFEAYVHKGWFLNTYARQYLKNKVRTALSQTVPDAVRRLPTELRERGDAIAQSDLHDSGCSAQANGWYFAADVVEHALAKHPADGDSPAVPDGYALIRQDVVDFLHGTAPLDGEDFCDRQDRERGRYWWRKLLPPFSAAAPTPGEDGGE